VDEVNLLDDGLVDVVLDSAASGVNTVEREGISIAHPARFIMIGSGNPSEVPQLCPSFSPSMCSARSSDSVAATICSLHCRQEAASAVCVDSSSRAETH